MLGHAVTIFAPYRRNPITEKFAVYHQLKADVKIRHLGSFDPISSFFFPGVLGLWMLNWMLRRNLKRELHDFDLLYTRSPSLLPTLITSGIPVVLELHSIPRRNRQLFVRLCNQCKIIVALTGPMAKELKEIGVTSMMTVEGDAVDLQRFSTAVPSPEFASDAPLIVYAGQLESMGLGKGIPELLGALSVLKQQNVPFHAVIAGGPVASQQKFQSSLSPELASSITFAGLLQHEQIPGLLKAASVLVYPAPSSSHPFYVRDTSPLKIFEYAAAGKPIVAADLPPLRDVFDDTSIFFVPPGDASALAAGIQKAIQHPERAEQSQSVVREYTWQKRMQRILNTVF